MSAVRIDTKSARELSISTEIVIYTKRGETLVERVTLVRYAGFYRTDGQNGIDAFVVRDQKGKVKVRSNHDLGLSEESTKVAYLAPATDDPAGVVLDGGEAVA